MKPIVDVPLVELHSHNPIYTGVGIYEIIKVLPLPRTTPTRALEQLDITSALARRENNRQLSDN